MTTFARQTALLLRPLARALELRSAAIAAGAAIAAVAYTVERGPAPPANETIDALRVGALLLSAGAAFALDDPARTTVEPAPLTLGRRRAIQVGFIALPLVAVWSGLCGYVALRSHESVPVVAMSIEVVATMSVALAAAAFVIRRGRDVAGPIVVPVILVLRMVSVLIPEKWGLIGGEPGSRTWTATHQRWFGLWVLCVLTVIALSRDPARKHRFA